MNNGYIDFNEKINEKGNEGSLEEIEQTDEGATNLLGRFEFKRADFAAGETGTVTITGIEVSDYCVYIGDTTVVIPETIMGAPVTAIADYASDCTSTGNEIRGVTFPKTLKSVGKGAFADMGGFNSVEIPASVTEIGEYAFGYLRETAKDESYEKIDDFVISCYPGTAAEKYAKDNGFEYKLLKDK